MRHVRKWETGEFSQQRPLCFLGWPGDNHPSSFPYQRSAIWATPPSGTALLEYKNGWTALFVWNGDAYFTEEIVTFDAMLELIRARFDRLPSPIRRYEMD